MIRSLLFALLLISSVVCAEQKQESGEHVVHYSAQNTVDLSPEVAKQYGISRDSRVAMVMITAQKKSGEAVAAAISGRVRNLLGQVQPLEMREIREGRSIYYLGLFEISNRDTQNFDFDIRPEGGTQALKLRFSQQFFVN